MASFRADIQASLDFNREADKLLIDGPWDTKIAYHYCGAQALLSIVQNGSVWASDLRCMNDTRELEHGMALIREAAKGHSTDVEGTKIFEAALAHKTFSDQVIFAASFSEDRDVLSQWRAYADDGAGYAIGFDVQSLLKFEPEFGRIDDGFLLRVEYNLTRQRELARKLVDEAFAAIQQVKWKPSAGIPDMLSLAFAIQFGTFAGMCKSDAFAEEREIRLCFAQKPRRDGSAEPRPKSSFRVGKYGLTPYLTAKFSKSAIREIVRGPKHDQGWSERVLRRFLVQNEVDNAETLPLPHSRASYR